jgi:hypothetical protein
MQTNNGNTPSPENNPTPEQRRTSRAFSLVKTAWTPRTGRHAVMSGRPGRAGAAVLATAAAVSLVSGASAAATAPAPQAQQVRAATPVAVAAPTPAPAAAAAAPAPAAPAPEAPAKEPSLQDKIIQAAQQELGTKETGGDNCQKYSKKCVSWCALFAMTTWEKAGVDVENDDYAFTGNVYATGKSKGTAYDGKQLKQAKPGDVLLFGTGPSSPSTSKHIGVVEKVDGDTVTTIEGNSGPNHDRVVRKQHTLSTDTFYGGVHPW